MGLLLCLVFPIFYGIQYLYKVMTDQPMKDFFDARSEVNTMVNELLHGAEYDPALSSRAWRWMSLKPLPRRC